MKKLLLFIPLLVGCASVRFVTTERGKIVDEQGRALTIIGDPPMSCIDEKGNIIADGYFVYQKDANSFLIDEFGKDYVVVKNPHCQVGRND